MKKIAALIFMALFTLSITACGSQQDTKSTSESSTATTQSDTKQDKVKTNSNVSTATTSTGSKATSVNPNAKFAGKPAQKQQMDNAAKDLKDTMSQIQGTINSLDTASDVNTDSIQ